MSYKHPGYHFSDGLDYSTKGDLTRSNSAHDADFLQIIEQLKLHKGTIVDVGCGNGFFLSDPRLIQKFPNLKRIGIDKKEYESSLVNYVVGDARLLPIRTGIGDLVVSTVVSQWIREGKSNFYKELERITAPNGSIIVFPFNPDSSSDLSRSDWRIRTLFKGPAKTPVYQLLVGEISHILS